MFLKTFVLLIGVSLAHGFEDKTIAQWLTDNGYTTLVTLLKQAGLYTTLDSPGAYTLFAPSEAAFAKLPPATVNAVTGNAQLLQNVLKYHVLTGYTMAPTIQDGNSKATLEGQSITFGKFPNGTISVDNAKIIPALSDIILNNGVIHVVDTVLLPVTDTIGEVLLRRGTEFSTLNMLLTITDLEPALLAGNITLFAPTNAAFNGIGTRLPDFSAPGAIDTYKKILLNHVVNGTVYSKDLRDGMVVKTKNGTSMIVNVNAGGVTVHLDGSSITATVTEADVKAANGPIHVIDQVLLPKSVGKRRRNIAIPLV